MPRCDDTWPNPGTSRLHRIVRKVHCVGTHQRFAIDALPMIRSQAGQRLSAWILLHHRAYLRGANDPDIRFRDFHNHLLDVQEDYWGGAPRVTHQWYDRLQRYIRAERFRDAAHAAGVLSHYITDVIQPLHTVSSDREAIIHRPLEWSIDQSYDRICNAWRDDGIRVQIELSDQPGWLGSMMLRTAHEAHQRSAQLMRHYRFLEGVETPRDGLDTQSISCLAELFAMAITAVADVLSRAGEEAEAYTGYAIPRCQPGWALFGTTWRAPLSVYRRYIRQKRESSAVRALAEEYFRTGKLDKWLPPEVDIKRRVLAIRHEERLYRASRRRAGQERRRMAA